MAIGSIYELTHTCRLFGKPVVNVYHFRAENADTSAEDLASTFQEEILPLIEGIQTVEVTADRARVITLFDFTDFWDGNLTGVGRGGATDTLPRNVAMNFTLRTNVRNIGPGAKRYAGISAGYHQDHQFVGAPFLGAVELLRLALMANPLEGDASEYRGVIVKRIFYEATVTSKAGYYMPRTEPELEWAYVTNVAVNLDVSSQSSRS